MRLFLLAALVTASVTLIGQPAECVWCPTYTCYGPCGNQCVCLSQPGEVGGSCYGVNAIPEKVALGYRLLR